MSKFDQLKEFVLNLSQKNVKIVAIALQEIWSVPYPDLVNIPGFKFVYKLRTSGRGGGVGFYVNDVFQFSLLNLVPFVDSQFENIVLETVVDNKKHYLCNIYRAPSSPANESQRDLIENFNSRLEVLMNLTNKPLYNSLIFMDSNINLLQLNSSQLSAEFLDTCHANGFIVSNLKASRICNDSYSLIDQILSNNIDNNITTGSIVSDLSDHFMIFFSSDLVEVKCNKKFDTFRAFSLENMNLFRDELRNCSWNNVLLEQDVNMALDQFLDTFTVLADLYFPEKQRKKNKNFDGIKEFMTKGLLISRKRKNVLFKKKILHPTDNNVNTYRIYHNIYNALIRRSKKMYFESALSKFRSKPKKIWEIINHATGARTSNSKLTELSVNGSTVCNDKDMAMAFNDHFTNIGTEIINSIDETNVDPISYIPDIPNVPEFTINNTGPVHVIDVVKSMQSKSSSDCCNVSMKLVKFVIYEIAVPLAHIFQRSIETGIFPEKFKKSRVVPIFKCGDSRLCDNYRPIALINTFSKILEKVVATDLYNHLDINNLIYIHQYGFQRNKSTEHNLIILNRL
jgi:hypothetical protein